MGNNIIKHKDNENEIIISSYNINLTYYSDYKCKNIIMYLNYYKYAIIGIQGIYNSDVFNIIKGKIAFPYIYHYNEIAILSFYEFINIKYIKFNNGGILFGYVTINNVSIMIYNLLFTYDTHYNDNSKIRCDQYDQLKQLLYNNWRQYKNIKIHLVIGSLNMENISNDFMIDIINYIGNDNLYTTIYKKKYDYIFLYNEDIINNNINELLQSQGLSLVDCNVLYNLSFSTNYPCEVILRHDI